jgi:hypothetical protein
MAAQTETDRKAAAQKAAATRKRNQAKRSQAARKAAATRARAQASAVKAAGYEAQRALDTSIGAAITARDRVVDAARPLTKSQERKRKVRDLRDSAETMVRKAERRGASARKRAVRTVSQRVRKGRGAAEERVEQRADQARATADGALREASERVGGLKERVEPSTRS